MSWLFSRALVEACSPANCSGGAPSVPSSATPMPRAYLSPDYWYFSQPALSSTASKKMPSYQDTSLSQM